MQFPACGWKFTFDEYVKSKLKKEGRCGKEVISLEEICVLLSLFFALSIY